MNSFFIQELQELGISIITNAMNVTCPKDLFKNELLFIQELQELGISIITNAMNVTCPKDLFKNEFLFILFKNYRNWEFLSTFYDAIHLETTYTANLQFQNSARVPVYDC